jgi:hypothetical protein
VLRTQSLLEDITAASGIDDGSDGPVKSVQLL